MKNKFVWITFFFIFNVSCGNSNHSSSEKSKLTKLSNLDQIIDHFNIEIRNDEPVLVIFIPEIYCRSCVHSEFEYIDSLLKCLQKEEKISSSNLIFIFSRRKREIQYLMKENEYGNPLKWDTLKFYTLQTKNFELNRKYNLFGASLFLFKNNRQIVIARDFDKTTINLNEIKTICKKLRK